MISYIQGKLASVTAQKAVVETGGIGFEIYMSGKDLAILGAPGSAVKIYTYLQVKEDDLSLFGFLDRESQEIFRLLIGVSGIGPKGALNILSALSVQQLRLAVLSGDAKAISAAPGIGKKTAEKLILELKDKMDLLGMPEELPDGAASAAGASDGMSPAQEEAAEALKALGYGAAESLAAVGKSSDEAQTTEEILREALKYLL